MIDGGAGVAPVRPAGGAVTDARVLDPAQFPGASLDPESVRSAADDLIRSAEEVRQGGSDVLAEWRHLAQHYEAPEGYRLLHVMDPVEHQSRWFADDLDRVAAALHEYADEVTSVLDMRRIATIDAESFLSTIAGNADWRQDQALVDKHMELLRFVNEAQVALWDAERRCANAIRARYGALALRVSSGADDPRGYGWAAIPDAADMPWGAEVRRQDVCAKAAAVQVKRFVWDGALWDGLMGAGKGVAALGGVGDESDGSWGWSHSWDAAGATWSALPALIGHAEGEWAWGTAGEAWLGIGKGLLSWDTWADDPARASGGAILNVATFVVPLVGGTRTLGTLGKAGRAGAGVRAATSVVDPAEVADDLTVEAGRSGVVESVADVTSTAVRDLEDAVLLSDDIADLVPPDGHVVADWTVRAPRAPLSPQEFITPTNPPQPPWRFIPEEWGLRVMGRTRDYPDGYWSVVNESGQPVDISTKRPPGHGSRALHRARTHVPLPPDWIS